MTLIPDKKYQDSLLKEIYKEEVRYAMKMAIRAEIADNPEIIKSDHVRQLIEVQRYKKQQKKEGKRLVFVTVNPRPDVTLDELMTKVTKCVFKKWIEEYYFVIEQRGTHEGNMGEGIHAHILLDKGDKKPCEVEREVRNTFKQIVGNSKHVDIKMSSLDQKDSILRYMEGDKDQSKLDKVEMDKEWRLRNQILPMYTSFNYDDPESEESTDSILTI